MQAVRIGIGLRQIARREATFWEGDRKSKRRRHLLCLLMTNYEKTDTTSELTACCLRFMAAHLQSTSCTDDRQQKCEPPAREQNPVRHLQRGIAEFESVFSHDYYDLFTSVAPVGVDSHLFAPALHPSYHVL